jgi:hypothetical protein
VLKLHGNSRDDSRAQRCWGHSSTTADYLAGLTSSLSFGREGNPMARPPNVNGRGGGSRGSTSGAVDVPRLEVGEFLVEVSAAGRLVEWSYDGAGVKRLV